MKPAVAYFASPVVLGPDGLVEIQQVKGLSQVETKMMEEVITKLSKDIEQGVKRSESYIK